MSMPIIKPSTVTKCQAITDIIESVALEQTALSHILNAEGEKLQYAIAYPNITPEQLLEFNESVQCMINATTRLELILQSKLELFKDKLIQDCPVVPNP